MNSLFESRISIHERTNSIAGCDRYALHFAAWRLGVKLLLPRIYQPDGCGMVGNALASPIIEIGCKYPRWQNHSPMKSFGVLP
jgi:hypothetical protein